MHTRVNSIKVNAALNAIKQVCAIIFPIISFSYASRVIGAEGIGIYSFAHSIISYILLIASMGITNYAVREGAKVREDKTKVNRFCDEVFSINLTFTFLSYIVLAILLFSWERLYDYKYVILIQSTAIILTTLGADWINTIYEDYLYLTIRYIFVQVISLLAMVLFVKSVEDLYQYIIICTFSSVGGNIFNIFYLRKRIRLKFVVEMNFAKHIVPMLMLFFNSVASVIYLNSDITMLRIFTDDKEVGIYTVSTKVYSVLKTLVNGVIYVTVPRFSYYLANGRNKEYIENFRRLFDVLFILTLPMAVGMFMLSENILYIFAGLGYESGADVIKILSCAFPFAVGSCLFSYAVLIPHNYEKYFMVSTIIAAVTNITLNIFMIPKYGMNGAAITTLFAEIIVYTFSSHYSYKCISKDGNSRTYSAVVIGTIGVAILCYTVSYIDVPNIVQVIISVVGSCLLYTAILLLLKVPEVREFLNIIYCRLSKTNRDL